MKKQTKAQRLSPSDYDYLWQADTNVYPRDTIIYEPVKVEYYTYTMQNRPASYGTCPEGRIVERDVYHLMSETDPNFGTVTYTRKLTADELYKWEMRPASDNAYLYPIGARVMANMDQDAATVTGHDHGFVTVRYDCNDETVGHRESELSPAEVVQVLLANESGIVGLVDMDVEPTSFAERKTRADAMIAEYRKIGRDALWAIGKGDGFWLKATDTLPAKYVSMQEAKKEIAIPAPLTPAEHLDRVSDEAIAALFPDDPIPTQMSQNAPSENQDHLKFWHCDYCHKGLTARDLHDITKHKVRCFECAAKHEIDPPPTKPAQLSLF